MRNEMLSVVMKDVMLYFAEKNEEKNRKKTNVYMVK